MSTEDLLAEVLRLPRPDRARVVEEVLTSLDEGEGAVTAAWVEELGRRSREIASDSVQPVSWEAACEGILRELTERRTRRAAS